MQEYTKSPITFPSLNRENGDFCFMPDFVVHSAITINDIPKSSFKRKEYIANNLDYADFIPVSPLTFAKDEWCLTIRFIAGQLSTVFVQVSSPTINKMTSDEYYSSGEERLKFHKQVLEKLCPKPHKFAWGKVSAYLAPQDTNTCINIEYKYGLARKSAFMRAASMPSL